MERTDFAIDAVVLANGSYPERMENVQLLTNAAYVVCCDGGANEYIRQGQLPNLIVGDGDSLSEENRMKYDYLLHRISEQETNDQTKAVSLLIANGKRRIAILGATGKREDHTLGNISLLIDYMRMGAEVRMYTDYGIFIPCKDDTTLPCHPGQQISIFNFTAQNLKSDQLAYPLHDFTSWWQGTLNECTGSSVTIHATGEYLVYLAH